MNGPDTLLGARWCLRSIVINGSSIDGAAEAGAYIVIGEDGRASGRGGCNRFFGGYTLEGSRIRFQHIASTRMYCERTMAVEDAFFKALELVRTASVEGDVLKMASEDGSTSLVFRRDSRDADDRHC